MGAEPELVGLIPAAGRGLRLGLPYPKELYPIIRDDRYKPVAQHVLENLVAAGVRHVVFVVNETKHQLMGYFGSGARFGCDLSYVVQEEGRGDERPSGGLAQALDAGWHLTRGRTVLFGMADTIMEPVDLMRRLVAPGLEGADLALAAFPTDQPHKFGMIEHDPDGRVRAIVDKPRETALTHMWGCLAWRPAFGEHLHASLEREPGLDFASVMNAALRAGLRARAVPVEGGRYVDVGTYDEIARLEREHRS